MDGDGDALNYDQIATVPQACAYSVLATEFRCAVAGALEQRNLPAPGGLVDYWPGIQTPAQCASICTTTEGCLSFDHSTETGRCYLGDGIAGVHAVLWSPMRPDSAESYNYRYYERIPEGNSAEMNEARAEFLRLPSRPEDADVGCRYGCSDWRAENYDPNAQDIVAVGDRDTCRYRAEPALAAFHEAQPDRVFITGGVPGDGRFVAQYGSVRCEEICAARCLAAGPACVAINYARQLRQCYLLPRTAEPGAALGAPGGLRRLPKYVYRERRVLRLPQPWGATLPRLITYDELDETVWPAANRTAVLGSLLRFDLPEQPVAGLALTDIWRRMLSPASTAEDLADAGCGLDGGTPQVVAALSLADGDSGGGSSSGDDADRAMMWLPWRNITQAVAPPVAWSEDEDAQRSALVALDAVGMARFLPRSAALCALGMQVTIEVTSGAPGVAPAAC